MVLPSNYRVIFGNQVAKGELRTLHVPRAVPASSARPPAEPWRLVLVGLLGGLVATVVGFWLVRRFRR